MGETRKTCGLRLGSHLYRRGFFAPEGTCPIWNSISPGYTMDWIPIALQSPVGRNTSSTVAPKNNASVFSALAGRYQKKGFDILLQALAALPDDFHWRWQHVGGGSAAIVTPKWPLLTSA